VTSQRPILLLLIPHLGGGGAERVTALLAQGLSSDKYEVHLGLVTERASVVGGVPSSVTVHSLGARRVRCAALPLLALVRRLKPDIILSGMAHLNFLVLLLRPWFPDKTRVLVRQNTTVSAALHSGQLPRYTALLYRFLYPAADRIVCQTEAMAIDLALRTGVEPSRMQVLANPVDTEAIQAFEIAEPAHWPGPGPHLLAVGRLSREKGFDLLLESFSSLRLKFPSADLTIIGEGPERPALETMRRLLRLESSVQFAGYVCRPESYFPGATLFVLSSRVEGLPNCLLEAAAGGLPIVALPAAKGIADLIERRPGTWLAREVSSKSLTSALLDALRSLLPGQRFAHPWVEAFGMKFALQGYENLIDATLSGVPAEMHGHQGSENQKRFR
jgi:glycosyltransferase involved in cell wall biosynthesis